MEIDDIQRTVEEFIKRLQLPDSHYDFSMNCGSDCVEFMITVDDVVSTSVSIGLGTIRVIYSDDYDSNKYVAMKFLTPVHLLYLLLVFFFNAVQEVSTLNFNDLLSVVLLNEIYDWKTLSAALCESLNLSFDMLDDSIVIEGAEIRYIPYLKKFMIDDIEVVLEEDTYTSIVEGTFKCVEYIANLADKADDLFLPPEEEFNVIEEMPEENEETSGGGMDMDMDIDVGSEEPAEVPPVEQETFEEPQSPVVEMEDIV